MKTGTDADTTDADTDAELDEQKQKQKQKESEINEMSQAMEQLKKNSLVLNMMISKM